jgi:hypothetical protein
VLFIMRVSGFLFGAACIIKAARADVVEEWDEALTDYIIKNKLYSNVSWALIHTSTEPYTNSHAPSTTPRPLVPSVPTLLYEYPGPPPESARANGRPQARGSAPWHTQHALESTVCIQTSGMPS